jgi:hypothetical protein
MTSNPWMFGLEAVQQGWQAQIALTGENLVPPDSATSRLAGSGLRRGRGAAIGSLRALNCSRTMEPRRQRRGFLVSC